MKDTNKTDKEKEKQLRELKQKKANAKRMKMVFNCPNMCAIEN